MWKMDRTEIGDRFTATKTFDVYADGELLGENIAMSCKTENIVMEKSGQHFLF